MSRPTSDIAFTARVKDEQQKRGSRAQYKRMEDLKGWPDRVTPDLAAVIANVRSFYLGTTNGEGQPYIQHRGGPRGFLHVVDDKTLGFADYGGNRQFITIGNLADNPRAFIFLMDYAHQRRVKLWGRARVVEGDDELLRRLSDVASGAPQRVILFEIEAWDRNCNQHIPMLLPAEDVERALAALEKRIETLQAENERLRQSA